MNGLVRNGNSEDLPYKHLLNDRQFRYLNRAPEFDHCRLIPLSIPAKWLGYRPIDTLAIKMNHPSKGSPRTANTWGYIAVHEKQEANKATASRGELPRLPSREGRKKQKLRGRKNQKGEQTLGYLGVVKPVTPREDVPLRGFCQ
ncbi:hypothetical protein AVEN_42903-1 [Araneus ventricosus]|uniref:Uncharacterized protein n=1 Tax=Araneus ventricosus TaxID=182803 RepID=A0A4Y2AGL6_ARAVE|nr:hypothetical protein AVEN_42903-1 [Araneus ventricosus]